MVFVLEIIFSCCQFSRGRWRSRTAPVSAADAAGVPGPAPSGTAAGKRRRRSAVGPHRRPGPQAADAAAASGPGAGRTAGLQCPCSAVRPAALLKAGAAGEGGAGSAAGAAVSYWKKIPVRMGGAVRDV